MDTVRYILALFVVLFYPVSIMLWLAIHPWVSFWRKLGTAKTYLILSIPSLALMVALFISREFLMAKDFGSNLFLISAAAICLIIGMILNQKRRKHLTFSILSGDPELSGKKFPGKLLTEGPYAYLRHPRYVEVFFWTLGYTLFANYLASYIAFLISIPLLYLVVILEEKELRIRFGKEYEIYCQKVPRFFPRLKHKSRD